MSAQPIFRFHYSPLSSETMLRSIWETTPLLQYLSHPTWMHVVLPPSADHPHLISKFRKNYIPVSFGSKVSTNSIIPNDLALCILSNLPVKSLMRFQCIRKSWSDLFENSHFMTMYKNHFISRHDYHTFILSCHSDLPITHEYLYHSEFICSTTTASNSICHPHFNSVAVIGVFSAPQV